MKSELQFGRPVGSVPQSRNRVCLSVLFLVLLLPLFSSFSDTKTPLASYSTTRVVQQALDVSPPVWPPNSNLTASLIMSTGLLLIWTNATDDVRVLYYNVTQDGHLIATVSCGPDSDPLRCQSYYVSGLTPNTYYAFQVLAGDTVGFALGPPRAIATARASGSNSPPTITVPKPQTVPLGTVLTFTVNASDPDPLPEQVTLTASGLPTGASFPTATGNPASNTFSWTPSSSQGPANYTVTFQASDGVSLASKSVFIMVSKGFRSPTLTVPTTQTVSPGTILSFVVIALDLNNPPIPVTLAAAGLPSGSSFDNRTGLLIWTPTTSQSPGLYNLVFIATNARGSTSSKVEIDVVGSTASAAADLQLLTGGYSGYLAMALIFTLAFVSVVLLLRKRGQNHEALDKVTGPIGNGKETSGPGK